MRNDDIAADIEQRFKRAEVGQLGIKPDDKVTADLNQLWKVEFETIYTLQKEISR